MSEVKEIKKRIDFLDYLKAICVIMVIITHYDWGDKDSPFFTMLINMAVPVFMIISGYLTAVSIEKNHIRTLSEAWSAEVVIPKALRFLIPFSLAFLIEIPILVVVKKEGFIEIIETLVRGGRARFLLRPNTNTTDFYSSNYLFYSEEI